MTTTPAPTSKAPAALKTPEASALATLAVDPKEAARKAAKKAKKATMKAAKEVILSALKDEKTLKALPESLVAALKAVFAATKPGGSGGNSLVDKIAAMFTNLEVGKGVDELELFKAFKIGRGEMRKRVRELVRDAAPADRLWVVFDEASETWVLKGKGEKVPAGWKGYLPLENA